MDELTNRSRAFAEAVVSMVWLVLLAVSLNRNSKMAGHDVPDFLLFLAGSAIITGIFPLMACCISDNRRGISDVAALFSVVTLFCIACWIALFTVPEEIVYCVACLSLSFTELRIFSYFGEVKAHDRPVRRSKEFHTILDGSNEFLCCMTGIHFLWLESLALEGLMSERNGINNALSEAMGIVSILFCAIGLCAMHVEMTPPLTSTKIGHIAGPIFGLDTFMVISVGTVLGASIWRSLIFPGLQLLILGPLIAAFILVLHVSCPKETEPPELDEGATVSGETEVTSMLVEPTTVSQDEDLQKQAEVPGFRQDKVQPIHSEVAAVREDEEHPKLAEETGVDEQNAKPKDAPVSEDKDLPKLAPLGLTKLMVTGFLTVSITFDSPDVLSVSNLFLVFAAAAIVSGLTWRLLTQAQVRAMLENYPGSQGISVKAAAISNSAKTACFCAHTFIAVATVLLMFEICTMKHPTIETAPAPTPSFT